MAADTTTYATNPSLQNGPYPSGSGAVIRTAEWGIDNIINANTTIIQDESISKSRVTDTTQDQKGAVVSELDYDEREDLTVNFLCDTDVAPCLSASDTGKAVEVGDVTFSYAGRKWKVDTVTYTGNYASKKSYSLTAHKYKNFPAQTGA